MTTREDVDQAIDDYTNDLTAHVAQLEDELAGAEAELKGMLADADEEIASLEAALAQCRDDLVACRAGSSIPKQTPVQAAKVAQTMGVRIFPSYLSADKTYSQTTAASGKVKSLGVGWVTCIIEPGTSKAVTDQLDALAGQGIKFGFAIGRPYATYTTAQWAQMQATITRYVEATLYVHAFNEPNHVRGGGTLPADWDKQVAARTKDVYNIAKPLGIPVSTPPLWSGALGQHDTDLRKLAPQIKPYVSVVNYHLYPRGGDPSYSLDRFRAIYAELFGNLPVVCSEAGYFTAPNYAGGAENVTEADRAVYLPRMLLEYAKFGGKVSYFELLNDVDPTGAYREAWLGLVKTPAVDPATWVDSAAFVTLRNIQVQIKGLGSGAPVPVGVKVDAGMGVQQMLVGGDKGAMVFLWSRIAASDKTTIPVKVADSSGVRTVNVGAECVSVSVK